MALEEDINHKHGSDHKGGTRERLAGELRLGLREMCKDDGQRFLLCSASP